MKGSSLLRKIINKNGEGQLFTQEDHYRLKDLLDNVKGRFILSYNDDEFIKELYNSYDISGVERSSTLSSSGDNKEKYKELIIKNF